MDSSWSNSTFDQQILLENRIVGAFYIIFSVFCLVPYFFVLWTIIGDQSLRKKPTYIIVLHIGIADVFQLIFDGVCGGVFTFFGSTWGFMTNKIIGGIMNPN